MKKKKMERKRPKNGMAKKGDEGEGGEQLELDGQGPWPGEDPGQDGEVATAATEEEEEGLPDTVKGGGITV